MKIRIAKKKLKKIISEAYRIDKRRVKLKRMDDLFSRRYGYSKSVPIFISYIRENKAENKPAKKRKRSKVQH